MAMRVKFVDLSGYANTRPFKISIRCAYWSLRATGAVRGAFSIDGVDASLLANGLDSLDQPNTIELDFPPVFDEMGKPVMWNHQLNVNPNGNTVAGCVVLTYFDPALPEE